MLTLVIKIKSESENKWKWNLEKVWKRQCFEFLEFWEWLKITRVLQDRKERKINIYSLLRNLKISQQNNSAQALQGSQKDFLLFSLPNTTYFRLDRVLSWVVCTMAMVIQLDVKQILGFANVLYFALLTFK